MIKKRTVIFAFLALILLLLLVFRHSVVSTVKKGSAKVFAYEYIPNQSVNLEHTQVFFQKDSVYFGFRKDFRFHYQTIAVADFADSSRLIVLSEPPPHVSVDTLLRLFRKFNIAAETRQHRMGYDGFVVDILISMANATSENVSNIVKTLSEYLFFSDYKSTFLSLSGNEKRQYFMEQNLDYQITLYEFNQWFLEDNELFISGMDTANAFPFQTILSERKHGVFFSQNPGFVAWAMPKKSDIATQIPNIRRFTLDADLILGAIADSATLVVIGRERETKLTELPPLNVETILLLASITEKELSQSLDINDLMAGKMPDGRDWCPTYLSKELENTEFGDLLTITDILLKDWSESGTIQEKYYNYPEPSRYPFDRPLFRKLGLSELVYNWNTANAMYAIDLNGKSIYTLNRTGALPVSYFNSQAYSVSIGSSYENQAYNYFATLNNADLVRVVQYTALYQLFIDNEIRYQGEIFSAFPKNKPYLLQEPVTAFLKNIRDLPNEAIARISDSIANKNFTLYQHKKILEQLATYEKQGNYTYSDERREEIFLDVRQNSSKQLKSEILNSQSLLKGLNDEQFAKLCRYLAYPRGQRTWNEEHRRLYDQSRKIQRMAHSIGKPNFTQFGVNLNDVKNFFSNRLGNSAAPYLKTSSVIITYHDLTTTGGHNLSSKISRVNSLTNYKRGNSRGGRAPNYNPNPQHQKPSKPASSQPSVKPKGGSAPVVNPTSAPIRSRESVISTESRAKRGF